MDVSIKVDGKWEMLTSELYFKLFGTKQSQLVREGYVRRAKMVWGEVKVALAVDNSNFYEIKLWEGASWTNMEFRSYVYGMVHAWEMVDPFYEEEEAAPKKEEDLDLPPKPVMVACLMDYCWKTSDCECQKCKKQRNNIPIGAAAYQFVETSDCIPQKKREEFNI